MHGIVPDNVYSVPTTASMHSQRLGIYKLGRTVWYSMLPPDPNVLEREEVLLLAGLF